jgi:predicted MFS family arabinose efflux permease
MRWAALAPPPRVRRLAAVSLVTSVGDGVLATVSAVFLLSFVGLSPGEVTRGLAAGGAVALLVGIPVGILGDRVGPKPVYVGLLLLEGAAVAGYPLIEGPASFVAVAVVAIAANRSAPGVRNGLIAALTTAEARTEARAYLRSVTNAGTAIGAGLAGLALVQPAHGPLTAALLLDSATFVVAAVLVATLAVPAAPQPPAPTSPWAVLRSRTFLLASAGQALLSLTTLVLTLALPLWIITSTDAPPSLIGLLIFGSRIVTVALQVPVSRLADTPPRAVRSTWLAGLLIAVSCLAIAPTGATTARVTVALLVAGAGFRLLGEVLQATGGWTMSFTATTPGRACTYQATYSTALTAAAAVGPLLVGGVVSRGDGIGWVGAAGFFSAIGVIGALAAARVMALRHVDEPRSSAS